MDLLTKQVHLQGGEALRDVAIREGKIIEIAPVITGDAKEVVETDGRVLTPGFVENHPHLDKVLVTDRKPSKSGTLKEAVKVAAELEPTFTEEDIYDHAKCTLEMLIAHGTTALRTHVEFDLVQGFTGFKTVIRLKEEYKELIDIQVVAFPQGGIFKAPGTKQMIHETTDMGTDVVGGIPYNDAPAEEHIDLVFEVAKKCSKDVDLHQGFVDEVDDVSIEYLCEETIAEGYQDRASVDHLTALHVLPEAELAPTVAKVAEVGISVMALPATDLYLGIRGDQYNVRRAVTPIRRLRDGDVNACIATNNIHNAFIPYGTEDIIQTTMLTVPVGHLGGADDLKTVLSMVTASPAHAMGLRGCGVAVGNKADLVLLDTKVVGHMIIDTPERLHVIKSGRVTVKTDKRVKTIR